jgi:hypothetical protein
MLPADRFDDPLSDDVRAQLGQAPPSERQTRGRGRLAGQAPDGLDLPSGQAWRSPHRAWSAQKGQAVLREIAEISIHGVDVDPEQLGDGGSGEFGGKEQEHFRPTTLPGLQGPLQPLMDLAEFA